MTGYTGQLQPAIILAEHESTAAIEMAFIGVSSAFDSELMQITYRSRTVAAKKYPLPKRFSAALSEEAYAQLRTLNERYHYGNNYLLTIILENFEDITITEAVEKAFSDFATEYGAPAPNVMKRKK